MKYSESEMIGRRFNNLVVLERGEPQIDKYGKKLSVWICLCDCGAKKPVLQKKLVSGLAVSCGCKNKLIKRDLTNQKFGHLIVIRQGDKKNGRITWVCRCDCGNEKEILMNNLVKGKTKSCGCMMYKDNKSKYNGLYKKNKRLYNIWRGMHERCYNIKSESYKNYGKRGISICDEWKDIDGFKNFINWSLSNGYSDELTIDRIDVNKGYSPDNCRWATTKMQSLNKRNNKIICCNGKTQTVSEWAKELNINESTLYMRLRKGWSDENVILLPVRKRKVMNSD